MPGYKCNDANQRSVTEGSGCFPGPTNHINCRSKGCIKSLSSEDGGSFKFCCGSCVKRWLLNRTLGDNAKNVINSKHIKRNITAPRPGAKT